MSDTCQSCGASIVWVETGTGRRMPLDPKEIEIVVGAAGRTVLVTDTGASVRGTPVDEAQPDLAPTFAKGRVSHFATCPQSRGWRGRQR
jgi:hypothetical protein